MYSEAASSYKGDEDDALSHYMGQSEYGGLSQIGGRERGNTAVGGIGTIGSGLNAGGLNDLGGGIPTIDTGKSRRMAGRPSITSGDKSSN